MKIPSERVSKEVFDKLMIAIRDGLSESDSRCLDDQDDREQVGYAIARHVTSIYSDLGPNLYHWIMGTVRKVLREADALCLDSSADRKRLSDRIEKKLRTIEGPAKEEKK